jgi:hypothetical protein
LPWNNRKSWPERRRSLSGASGRDLHLLGHVSSGVSFGVALLCVVLAVLVGRWSTLLTRFNDNIFVGVSAAATVIAMHGAVVGGRKPGNCPG